MNITIIVVGKIKEKFYEQGIKDYVNQLKRNCRINIIEIPDEKTPDNLSSKLSQEVKVKEGKGILQRINEGAYVVALAIDGDMKTTEAFEKMIKNNSNKEIVFIIGGSLGLSDEVLKKAHQKISFSKMTFPHQLMRVILLEQINRVVSK